MHTVRNVLVIALIPFFSGCLPIPAFRHQGLVTQGESRPLFTSCDGTQRQILLPHRYYPEGQEEIVNQLKQSGVLFVDLYGRSAGWKKSLLEVDELLRLEHSPDACSEPDFKRLVLRAFGNEPNWNLRLIDKRLYLDRPGEPSLDVPYIRSWSDAAKPYIKAEANGETLSLWLTTERCVDRITGGIYRETARLHLGDKVLQGCSYSGDGSDFD